MKNERRHSKSLWFWQYLAKAARRTHCLGSSWKRKRFESQPLDVSTSSASLSLSVSSSPPLVTPQTESFLDGFPKLSGVSREALTQHCPLCMHGSSWVQPACLGREEGERRNAAACELWLRPGRLSEPALTNSIKQLLFPGESAGGRRRAETDRDGNTERVLVTALTHRKPFSALTS